MASARGRIDKLIKEYTVFVVSKSSCPFCHTAKKVLHDYDIPPEKYKVIEIEGDKECSAIQDYMHQLTGARTVRSFLIWMHFHFLWLYTLLF